VEVLGNRCILRLPALKESRSYFRPPHVFFIFSPHVFSFLFRRYVCLVGFFFVRSIYHIGCYAVRSFVRLIDSYVNTYIIIYIPNYKQANKPIDQTIFFSCLVVFSVVITTPHHTPNLFTKIILAPQIKLTF
jgi:hypothetical protein